MDDDFEDFNIERLAQAVDGLADRNSAGLDHVLPARRDLRKCVDVVHDARIDGGVLTGRLLDDHLQLLIQIEHDLSRAEGELS